MADHVDLNRYCDRIGYRGPRTASLATLHDVVRLHTHAIAFENLDSLLGKQVALDLETLQHKLLHPGRGGYCFEHNTLLWQTLQQFGFKVSGLAARVRWNVPEHVATPIGHMLLNIELENANYIVDAGFGGITLTAPLLLHSDEPQATTHERFRLILDNHQHILQVEL